MRRGRHRTSSAIHRRRPNDRLLLRGSSEKKTSHLVLRLEAVRVKLPLSRPRGLHGLPGFRMPRSRQRGLGREPGNAATTRELRAAAR
eukprot:3921895-Pyramimonas_sp.AAC.1